MMFGCALYVVQCMQGCRLQERQVSCEWWWLWEPPIENVDNNIKWNEQKKLFYVSCRRLPSLHYYWDTISQMRLPDMEIYFPIFVLFWVFKLKQKTKQKWYKTLGQLEWHWTRQNEKRKASYLFIWEERKIGKCWCHPSCHGFRLSLQLNHLLLFSKQISFQITTVDTCVT